MQVEYVVVTTASRILSWHANDYNELIRDLHFYGHTPVYIKPMSEYEAEIMARDEQERLTHELMQAIEEERKTA